MGRISTAFRAFFQALGRADVAARIEQVLAGKSLPASVPAPSLATPAAAPKPPPAPRPPAQSEAITLLAALQREARLVDFLQEDLTQYADEQIGAAVREIQRDGQKVLARYFEIRPILLAEEGADVEVPGDADGGRYRLTGNVSGTGARRGTLQHHGWEATKCDLPSYTGSSPAAKTIAPAEIEIA